MLLHSLRKRKVSIECRLTEKTDDVKKRIGLELIGKGKVIMANSDLIFHN